MEKELRFDEDQLKAVNSNINTIVSAGAGSGKTSVLSGRFLRLVKEEKAKAENILTLTFTRKAAAEMYNRIYHLLIKNRSFPGIEENISDFNRAQISTLDSFCAQIVRNWPQRFGISQSFLLDDHEIESMAEELSLDFMLSRSRNPYLKEFIRMNGFENVWKNFFTSLAAEYFTIAESRDYRAMHEQQSAFLEELLQEKIRKIQSVSSDILGLPPGSSKSIDTARAKAGRLPELEDKIDNDDYAGAAELCSRFKISKPSRGSSTELQLLKEYAENMKVLSGELEEILITLSDKEMFQGLFILCGEFEEAVNAAKRSRDLVCFHDVLRMAVITLKENLPLRRYYKKRFRYIMIDEFQDNNVSQKELLYLIAEKNGPEAPGIPGIEDLEKDKLFFVGDEKQSIYRFRGADVSVFKELKKEICGNGGISVELTKNYRSEPHLISFFNTIFPEVMKNAMEPFEAEFAPLTARGPNLQDSGKLGFLYKEYNDQRPEGVLPADECEAVAVARKIRHLIQDTGFSVWDQQTKESRPARYSDFALLMRSTSNQIKYERAFRAFGIPYSTQGVRSLFLEAPINDLYTALQTVFYPDDRLAFAGFLRSPFVNISDDTVIRILLENQEPFSGDEPYLEEMKAEERENYLRARELYNYLRTWADKKSIEELIFDLWYRYGYRNLIMSNTEYHEYLEYYDYLRNLARDFDSRGEGLALFLDFLRENLGKYERIPEISVIKEENEGVQILTIHKSKGLEFPVVFLCNTGNRGAGSREKSMPYYISSRFGITFNSRRNSGRKNTGYNYFYSQGEEENKRQEEAELKRLLYVAATRAEYHLFISGCHTRNNRNVRDTHLNMLINAVPDFPGIEQNIPDFPEKVLFQGAEAKTRTDFQEISRKYLQTQRINFRFPRRVFSVTELENIVPQEEAGEKITLMGLEIDKIVEKENLESSFGTLCHFILQRKLEHRYEEGSFPAGIIEAFGADRFSLFSAAALELTEKFFQSSLYRRIQKGFSLEAEVPFLYQLNSGEYDCLVQGRIDLLCTGSGEAVVVDFKTDREFSPGFHALQIALYMRAAREFTGLDTKGFCFYLREGKAEEIEDSVITDNELAGFIQRTYNR